MDNKTRVQILLGCTCGRLNTSSVNHRNDCPTKIEAIERLHLSPESPYVTAKGAQPK